MFFWGARDKDELLAVRTRALTNASGATINPPTPWTDPAVNALYTLSDSALSVVAFVSPSGRIRESRLYDAYGNMSRHLLGDLNADGLVDDTDFGIFNAAYDLYDCAGTAGGDAGAGMLGSTLTKWGCPADLNGDWVVDDADFSIFAAGYNQMIPEQDALVSGNAAGGGMLWGPGWTGAWYDPATGLWLSRNRWYDPLAGRWITRDPAGYVDGLSLYLYVKGNPFLFRDPSGLMAWYDVLIDHAANLSAGVADNLSFGATDAIRGAAGWNDTVDKSSKMYVAGEVIETVGELVAGMGLAKQAARQAEKQAAKLIEKQLAKEGEKTAAEQAAKQAAKTGEKEVGETATKTARNPYGSKGKPDHQMSVREGRQRAEAELREGEQVLTEKKIQHPDSNRIPDNQIVTKEGTTRKIFESERHPTRQRHRDRQAEYDGLGIEHETLPVGETPPQAPTPPPLAVPASAPKQ